MNKSLNAIDAEMAHCVDKTPEANKKKPKQLTLFEMSSGGKFALKCDQEKELQKSAEINKSNKKPLRNNKSKPNDENTENNENKPNGKQKKTTKSKLDNLLKPKDLNSDIEIIENDENKPKKEEEANKPTSSPPKKEEQKCIVLVEKLSIDTAKKHTTNIRDFFAKSQENQMKKAKSDDSSAATTSGATTSKPREVIMPAKVELSDKFLEDIGSFVTLRNLKLDEQDDIKKHSFYFGDLAMIIELNNLISKIYPEKKTTKKRGRKSIETTSEFTIANMKLDRLIDILNKQNSFNMLIKTYMKILLKEDDLFKGVKLFEIELNEIDIHDCMLTELSKLLTALSLVSKENANETSLLMVDEQLVSRSELLRALAENKSTDLFVNLNLSLRIELVKLLLHLILTGRKYEIYYEQMHNKLVNYEAKLKQGEAEFVEKLGIEYNVYKANKEKHIKEALESKKLKIYAEKLKQTKLNIEKSRLAYKACNRLVPIGSDSKENSYWSFSFMKKLIVEKTTSDESKSEWYTFTQTQANKLVEYLKSCKEDAKFVKLLKDTIESIYDGAEEEIEEQEVEEENKPDEDIMSCEEEEEDVKSKLAQFERRPTRSLRSNTNNNSQTEDDDVIFEQEGEKKNAKLDKMVYENQQEWLACFSECNSIQDLILLIVNQQIYLDQHGCLKVNSLKSLMAKLGDYDSTKSFDDQFEFLKQVACEMFDSLWHMLFNSKALSSGKLKLLKPCAEASSSLSHLYLMSYIYFRIIKWEALNEKFICKDCKKKGDKFRKTFDLKDLNEYDCETGFYLCITCKLYVHKKCAINEGKLLDAFTNGGLYHCTSCDEKKKNFYYATEVVSEQKKEEEAETDDDDDDKSHKLRKRKQVVDYNENKPNLKRSVSNSSVSSHASSTRSSIESSSTNESTRSGRRTKRNDHEVVESRGTRSSARLATTTIKNTKSKYVDEDSDLDD